MNMEYCCLQVYEGIYPLEVSSISPVSIPTNCLYSCQLYYLQVISFAFYLMLSKTFCNSIIFKAYQEAINMHVWQCFPVILGFLKNNNGFPGLQLYVKREEAQVWGSVKCSYEHSNKPLVFTNGKEFK